MSQLPAEREKQSLALRGSEVDNLPAEVSAFESDTYEVLKQESPGRRSFVIYSIFYFFVTAVIFCAFAKVDKVVTADGKMVSAGGKLYISPYTAGIVKTIRVKVGDIVAKGAVLAELDPTFAKADLVQVAEKLKADQAKFTRLQAEQALRPMRCVGNSSYEILECSLWRQRQNEFKSSLNGFDTQIIAARAHINTASSDVRQYSKRMEIASEVSGIYSPLAREGYVSKVDLARINDSKEELKRQLEGQKSEMDALGKSLANLQSQRNTFIESWRSTIEAALIQANADVGADTQALEKAQKQLELTTLVAPEAGVVLRVGLISAGSVTDRSGYNPEDNALITLAPLNKPLEVELSISAKDIGFIRVGDNVGLRLTAYSYVRHGSLSGQVHTISEGSFSYSDNNQVVAPYFKVRVTLGDKKLHGVPADFRLLPGLTLNGDIAVGKRTILSYMVEGALRTGSEAMREPQ